jgi:hypothetical protein
MRPQNKKDSEVALTNYQKKKLHYALTKIKIYTS